MRQMRRRNKLKQMKLMRGGRRKECRKNVNESLDKKRNIGTTATT